MKFFKFLNSVFLLVSLLACNGMGKDEIQNFKYKDVSNYYFKIGSNSYSVKILRNYNENNLGRAIDIKECAIIYKEKMKKWGFCYDDMSMWSVTASGNIIEFKGGAQDRDGNIVDFYILFKKLASEFYLYEYTWKFGYIDENTSDEKISKVENYYTNHDKDDRLYINQITPKILSDMRKNFMKK
ncbi:hypothetical protein [Campylobacter concisus]|uniref:hypothetical protein n=1 Tax=Campylobacter concisus TaxID=199 RepID=UPI0011E828CC|nr:hypothetical protein [Campylobacter concisus]